MTISVVAIPEPDHVPPRIRLQVSSTTSTPNPVPATVPVVVNRITSAGSFRVIIPEGSQTSAGSWIGYDYHAPSRQPVSYEFVYGSSVGTSAQVQMDLTGPWLLHPIIPSLAVRVEAVYSLGERVFTSASAAHWPIGSHRPIVVSDGVRRDAASTMTLRVDSPEMEAALLELFADDGPVLVNLADRDGWWDESWAWIQPGDVTATNRGETIRYPYRHISFPYQRIDPPAVAAMALWTCGDVAATYASCADVAAAYASCAMLAADIRVA